MKHLIDISEAATGHDLPEVKALQGQILGYANHKFLLGGYMQDTNPCAHTTKIANEALELQKIGMEFYFETGNTEAYVSALIQIVDLCCAALHTEVQKELNAKKAAILKATTTPEPDGVPALLKESVDQLVTSLNNLHPTS